MQHLNDKYTCVLFPLYPLSPSHIKQNWALCGLTESLVIQAKYNWFHSWFGRIERIDLNEWNVSLLNERKQIIYYCYYCYMTPGHAYCIFSINYSFSSMVQRSKSRRLRISQYLTKPSVPLSIIINCTENHPKDICPQNNNGTQSDQSKNTFNLKYHSNMAPHKQPHPSDSIVRSMTRP